jgi:hypothetical protein
MALRCAGLSCGKSTKAGRNLAYTLEPHRLNALRKRRRNEAQAGTCREEHRHNARRNCFARAHECPDVANRVYLTLPPSRIQSTKCPVGISCEFRDLSPFQGGDRRSFSRDPRADWL